MKTVIFQIVFLLMLGGATVGSYLYVPGLFKAKSSFAKVSKAPEKVWPVRVMAAKRDDYQIRRLVFGSVVAPTSSDLRFQIAGCVASTLDGLHEGKVVKKGQVIARLDTQLLDLELKTAQLKISELLSEKSEIETKLANLGGVHKNSRQVLKRSQSSLARQRQLSSRGVASKVALEKAEQTLGEAEVALIKIENEQAGLKASLKTMSQRLLSARQQTRKAQIKAQYAVLKAPHDGVISKTDLKAGTCVGAMTPVGRLVDVSSLEIKLDIPVHIFRALEKQGEVAGQSIMVLAGDDKRFEMKVARVLPELGAQGQMVQVVGRPARNGKPVTLFAGQTVRAEVVVLRLTNVLKLPSDAIFDNDSLYAVADGKLVKHTVSILGRDDQAVFVQSDLANDTPVMTTHLQRALNGLKVKVLAK